ncbi:MAG: helix-turn-helix domain-containing protein [Sphingopyxis terrae]|nr:helix-turn-helix domain-containing protein [Sphingopyxis terrae]
MERDSLHLLTFGADALAIAERAFEYAGAGRLFRECKRMRIRARSLARNFTGSRHAMVRVSGVDDGAELKSARWPESSAFAPGEPPFSGEFRPNWYVDEVRERTGIKSRGGVRILLRLLEQPGIYVSHAGFGGSLGNNVSGNVIKVYVCHARAGLRELGHPEGIRTRRGSYCLDKACARDLLELLT